jgi:AcrR family transcriptional regulator
VRSAPAIPLPGAVAGRRCGAVGIADRGAPRGRRRPRPWPGALRRVVDLDHRIAAGGSRRRSPASTPGQGRRPAAPAGGGIALDRLGREVYLVTKIIKRQSIFINHSSSTVGCEMQRETSVTSGQVETRVRILDAADRLFAHYGYAKTTVADIARALDMSPANVYRFFQSKLEIIQAICHRVLEERNAHNRAIAESEGSAGDRLKRFFVENHRRNLEDFAENPKYYEIVEVALEEDWVAIEDYLEEMADVIERLIVEGIATGEFGARDDVRRAAICARQAFVSLFHPTLLRQCRNDREVAAADELADFIIRALRCP